MTTITTADAQDQLNSLMEQAAEHKPVLITGANSNAVLVAEDDWKGMQETLYLLSIPGMRESIVEGMNTPLSECTESPDW